MNFDADDFALLMLGLCAWLLAVFSMRRRWPVVAGRVVDVDVYPGGESFGAGVAVEFDVKGRPQVARFHSRSIQLSSLRPFKRLYRPGSTLDIRYNPSNLSQVFPASWWGIGWPLAGIVASALFLISHRVFIECALCLLGSGGLYACLMGARREKAMKAWPTTQGRIIRSIIEEIPKGRNGPWIWDRRIRAVYEYRVGGKEFTSDYLSEPPTATPRTAGYVRRRYRQDTPVTVHYNPEAPENAVVFTRVFRIDWALIALSLGLIITGIASRLGFIDLQIR